MSLLHTPKNRPATKSVQLMTTCLCDAFFADVARATVEILEYLGVDIELPDGQTCCGQPAFNGGDWNASRKVVRHVIKTFKGSKPVVIPSGSCAAMIYHGAPLAFEKETDLPAVNALAGRSWELVDYIVNGLGVKQWEGTFKAKIAFHSSCHLRGSESSKAIRQLLNSINGIEIVPLDEAEQCCGFGGTFSVSFPNVSTSMGTLKVEKLLENHPDYIVSADMGCVLHLGGIIDKSNNNTPRLHVAQVLRDALKNAGKLKK